MKPKQPSTTAPLPRAEGEGDLAAPRGKGRFNLQGRRVAVVATNGFEESELMVPVGALEEQGAAVDILTPDGDAIKGWKDDDWAQWIAARGALWDANPADYDAVLLPGGVLNSDKLRAITVARNFVRRFIEDEKPVFAICHGAQILIDLDAVAGRKMTSYPSIAADLVNAAADWQDREVVEDANLVTSRDPKDLPAFCEKISEVLSR